MPVKIRLQRHGKKGKPFYWIVAADVRAKRDGRFLEKLGIYNPNTNPATVELSVERALYWIENGAQPTNTAKTLLSYRGVMLKHHLQGGVAKGAFSQEEADKRFEAWLDDKNARIQAKVDGLTKKSEEERSERLAAEKEISEKRKAAAEEAVVEEAAAEESNGEAEVAEEAQAVADEAPATEEAPAEEAPAQEAPAQELEAKEEVAEEPAADTQEESAEEATEKE
jgi:small subunit ribosomal protein S16